MRLIMLLLVFSLAGSALGQGGQVCKSCPSPKDMDLQFPYPENPKHEYKIFTKTYIGVELIHMASMSADSYITLQFEGHRCYEGNNGFPEIVHGKELALEDLAELGFGLFVRTIVVKSHPPKWANFISYMTPAYGIERHVQGASEWYYKCR